MGAASPFASPLMHPGAAPDIWRTRQIIRSLISRTLVGLAAATSVYCVQSLRTSYNSNLNALAGSSIAVPSSAHGGRIGTALSIQPSLYSPCAVNHHRRGNTGRLEDRRDDVDHVVKL